MNVNSIKEKLADRKPGIIGDKTEFAVLIPLVEKDGILNFVFEKRASGIRQPGDICFPGGKIEPGETIIECALRETNEEIGIDINSIQVLGRFDSILEVNRITMHTVVGVIDEKELDKAMINRDEVAEIFTVPVDFFSDTQPIVYNCKIVQDVDDFPYEKTGIRRDYRWRVGHQDIYIYHYEDINGGRIENRIIWGLTARIARWFVEKMK